MRDEIFPLSPYMARNDNYVIVEQMHDIILYINSHIRKRTFSDYSSDTIYFIINVQKFLSFEKAMEKVVELYEKAEWQCMCKSTGSAAKPFLGFFLRTDDFNPGCIKDWIRVSVE